MPSLKNLLGHSGHATLWLRHCGDFLFLCNGTYKGSQGLGPTRGMALASIAVIPEDGFEDFGQVASASTVGLRPGRSCKAT